MVVSDTASLTNPDDQPRIRRIGTQDLGQALAEGIADFRAVPTHTIFLSLLYPVIGLVMFRIVFQYNLVPLLFPLIAGFALLGPLAATGLYEISRQREHGGAPTWRTALDVWQLPSIAAIVELGAVLLAIFLTWIAIAYYLYQQLFPDHPATSLADLATQVTTSREGLLLLVVGNAIGFLFALVTFAISVASFPLLVQRRMSAPAAIVASVRAVMANPWPMAQWAVLVVGLLVLGSIPALIGLAVVLPILGHATWHLSRKLVAFSAPDNS